MPLNAPAPFKVSFPFLLAGCDRIILVIVLIQLAYLKLERV